MLLSLLPVALGQTCMENYDKAVCDFEVSPKPIAQFALTEKLGETLASCLGSLERFRWSAGIFCADSNFCDLGFNVNMDYSSKWLRTKFDPANETCQILVDSKRNSCDYIKNSFANSGLFSGIGLLIFDFLSKWRNVLANFETFMLLQYFQPISKYGKKSSTKCISFLTVTCQLKLFECPICSTVLNLKIMVKMP